MTTLPYRFKVGDAVVFTNDFGVCWGVRTVTGLDERTGKPTYFLKPTDAPWFSTEESNLVAADEEDLIMARWGFDQAWPYFQARYGFQPKEYYGCW